MKKKFWKVITREEALALFSQVPTVGEEKIPLGLALGRVAACHLNSPIDVPHFRRSAMDGYAVRAKNTYGATETSPVPLKLTGEVVVGTKPKTPVSEGEALGISTGAMLPPSADAVVMVEHTTLNGHDIVLVTKPVAPGENVTEIGSDIRRGEAILRRGDEIRPQEIGALAAVGVKGISVFRKPKVGIISTGDELVSPEVEPLPGQVRGVNQFTLSALAAECGGHPIDFGLVRDTAGELREAIKGAVSSTHLVLISGGSSVGARDLTLEVIESFENSRVLAHGVAVRPGKPTILATLGERPVIGLPGHPVSAMIVFQILIRPIIHSMVSRSKKRRDNRTLRAKLSRNVSSTSGREDYLRVSLKEEGGELLAHPILGSSSMLSTMVNADGLVRIDLEKEGLGDGELVEVMLW